LLRQRGERLERPNAHLYETGGMRRPHLRGHTNILKRLVVHAGGFNLGLLMRHLTGVGTPRSLQGRSYAGSHALLGAFLALWHRLRAVWPPRSVQHAQITLMTHRSSAIALDLRERAFATGC
jgi:hypothetical protein